MELKTREVPGSRGTRIQVSDGQGISGVYPINRNTADAAKQHHEAIRLYLAEQKGWMDPLVTLNYPRQDALGYVATATRPPSRPRKPVAATMRVARYLELCPESGQIAALKAEDEVAVRPLTVADLRALVDYIREA